ncbi:MAG TPA: FeoB small GTPase domain-containing protein, partial [Blastocatellia bacterium]|nr:FeoB small GTPase domain-containing protein [Blastocatellia bacterium]
MSTLVVDNEVHRQPETATKPPRLLLVGNPNVGKSVIFGYLTGKYVVVSNYPGTTVEVSKGKMRYGGKDWEVIDTPGVNSLAPQSDDERVTRDMLLSAEPDVIVQVADAKNLRRTLLITTQLAELGRPLLLVLNMMDEARSRGVEIDVEGIKQLFGIPVITTVAVEGEGLYEIFKTIHQAKVPNDPLAPQRERFLSGEPFARTLQSNAVTKLPLQLLVESLQTTDANLRQGVETWLERNAVAPLPNDSATRLRIRTSAARLNEMRNAFLDQALAQYKKTRPGVMQEMQGIPLKLALFCLIAGLTLFAYTELGRLFGLPTPYGWVNSWLDHSVIPGALNWLGGLHLGWLGTLLFGKLAEDGSTYETGLLYPAITQFTLLIAPVIFPLAYVLRRSERFGERLGHWTRDWRTGGPLMLLVLLLVYEFVGVIGAVFAAPPFVHIYLIFRPFQPRAAGIEVRHGEVGPERGVAPS